ncbi:MAG: RluA family pseudouridine synthase [Chitinophagaceae bacterium]
MKPEIVFEHENFIVANKPEGLLSIPDREGKEISLKVLLQQQYGNILTVHRLDKDTSGLIVFARNEATHKLLSKLFESRDVEKWYAGFVLGNPIEDGGLIDVPIMESPIKEGTMMAHAKGKPSLTEYKVVERYRFYSLVHCQIHTGRTHQIRVHMKHIGNSIVGDPLYGDGKPVLLSSFKKKFHLSKKDEEEKPLFNRLALHAFKLSFTLNNQLYLFEIPLPKSFLVLSKQLQKWNG